MKQTQDSVSRFGLAVILRPRVGKRTVPGSTPAPAHLSLHKLWFMDTSSQIVVYGHLFTNCGLWTPLHKLWFMDTSSQIVVYGHLFTNCGLWTPLHKLWFMDTSSQIMETYGHGLVTSRCTMNETLKWLTINAAHLNDEVILVVRVYKC